MLMAEAKGRDGCAVAVQVERLCERMWLSGCRDMQGVITSRVYSTTDTG